MNPNAPRCPACAVLIAVTDPQQIVTCEFCGTDSNLVRGVIPHPETPPPRFEERGDPNERYWTFEQKLQRFLEEPDLHKRLEYANDMMAGGADDLVWLGLLGDQLRACSGLAALEERLGKIMYNIVWTGGTRSRRQMLTVATRLGFQSPGSHVLLDTVWAIGAGGLRLLLDIAQSAFERGDEAYARHALETMRAVVNYQSGDKLAACLDILFYRLTRVTGAVRDWLVEYLADCVDTQYRNPVGQRHHHEDFGPLLPAMIEFLDDLTHDDPALAERFADSIVEQYNSWFKGVRDHRRWEGALAAAPTARGREAALKLFDRLYPQYPGAPYGDRSDLDTLLPPLPHVESGRIADVRDSQSRCPGCGRPLPLTFGEPIVACGHCGQQCRLKRVIRKVETHIAIKADDEFELWTPDQLVRGLEETTDPRRRIAIAREIASPSTDGTRYVEHAGTLVRLMMRADEDADYELGKAVRRVLTNGGEAMRNAIVEQVREHGFEQEGSTRLMQACVKIGPDMFPLLLELAEHAYGAPATKMYERQMEMARTGRLDFDQEQMVEQAMKMQYGMVAMQSALAVLHKADGDAFRQCVEHVLTVAERLSYSINQQLLASIVMGAFGRDEMADLRERLLRFVDDRINPAKTTWLLEHRTYGPRAAAQTAFISPNDQTMDILNPLHSSVTDNWEPPRTRDELMRRIDLIDSMRTAEVKVLIVLTIKHPPAGLSDDDRERIERTLNRLAECEPVRGVCEHVRKVLKRRPRRANDAGDAADDHEPDPDLDSYDPRLFIGQPLLLAATAVLCGAVFGAAWPTLLGGTKGRPAVFMATGVLALVVVMNIISAVAAWRAIRRIFDPGRRRMLMYVAAAGGLAGLLYVRLRVGPMLDASSRKAIRRIVALQAAAAVIGFVFIR